jgi:molybdopterin/thiamine biosynthesis adenylyltransferase
MKPRLKGVAWTRDGEQLLLVYDVRELLVVADPDGTVETLLELLRDGGRTLAEIVDELGLRGRTVPAEDVTAAVELLDSYRLLEDGRRLGRIGDAARERYYSNLAFFEPFARLERSQEDFQQALRDAHVLVLGTGGLNSNTIPHLCGLGVGRLTLLDRDTVEIRNFARQYLYRHADLGARKVQVAAEWVRGFDPAVKVEALDAGVDGPDDVSELVDRFAPDLVMSGIDHPNDVDEWVNAGCVTRGVPYVRGGMRVTQGTVWSVDPGVSACRTCAALAEGPDTSTGRAGTGSPGAGSTERGYQQAIATALYEARPRRNRGIGPVAGLLGALSALEVLRYLTRFEPPAYAGRPVVIDFAAGSAVTLPPAWSRHPSCPACRAAPTVPDTR